MSIRNQRQKARKLLVQALYQWHMAKAPTEEILAEFLSDNDVKKFDSEYFTEIFMGITQNVDEVDEAFLPFTHRTLKELDPIELTILRLSTYELLHKIEIPYRVVINEGIEQAKRYGATEGHKFINGVLDKAAQKIRAVETRNARI